LAAGSYLPRNHGRAEKSNLKKEREPNLGEKKLQEEAESCGRKSTEGQPIRPHGDQANRSLRGRGKGTEVTSTKITA
jgi:hypothetical protein